MKKTSMPKVIPFASLEDRVKNIHNESTEPFDGLYFLFFYLSYECVCVCFFTWNFCYIPEVVLEFTGYEGKDEGQQSQKDVISKNATDKDYRAFITLQNNLYVLGSGVLHWVGREEDEPHSARYGLKSTNVKS